MPGDELITGVDELAARRRVRAWVAGAWLVLVVGGWAATETLDNGIEATNGPRPAGQAPPSPTPVTLPEACPSRTPQQVPVAVPTPTPRLTKAVPHPTPTPPLSEPVPDAMSYPTLSLTFSSEVRDTAVATGGSVDCVVVTTR
ncbi:hypothetical protein G3I40_45905 [Streptomyces sp. SID14478]|uniref:hypothetical protein n=1 Tax=Streptomyces sp. SID14478 TaxID=2706073 RepID=UPI0013DF3863|nr:hypothetical protein [Streptomyces sp. SID14478]NEB82497.1 hypothetical protein [Streptomyces sp. SID14478]